MNWNTVFEGMSYALGGLFIVGIVKIFTRKIFLKYTVWFFVSSVLTGMVLGLTISIIYIAKLKQQEAYEKKVGNWFLVRYLKDKPVSCWRLKNRAVITKQSGNIVFFDQFKNRLDFNDTFVVVRLKNPDKLRENFQYLESMFTKGKITCFKMEGTK